MNSNEIQQQITLLWQDDVKCVYNSTCLAWEIQCTCSVLIEVCRHLFMEWNCSFAGLIVEQDENECHLRYCFYGDFEEGWFHVLLNTPLDQVKIPSIVEFVCAADWHEREIEDLFGLIFEGHPRLGNFVLHDDIWPENVKPMEHAFQPLSAMQYRKPNKDLRTPKILEEEGSFVLPIGPKYSGITESVQFLLETVGEDVIRANPRLFYKWRAIEKIAEGKTVDGVLQLAERFAATTAFAHGLAFCVAIESICKVEVPARAKALRIFLAELERLRHHVGAIQEICESTALNVANSQTAILEEDVLRISGTLTGHRYLFGLLAPGGLLCNLPDEALHKGLIQAQQVIKELQKIEQRLRISSSFLDRLEEVGILSFKEAQNYGVLGPVARASGLAHDLRRTQPYSGYQNFNFDVAIEQEGDGYARLRVLLTEAKQAVRIMEQAVGELPGGSISVPIQYHEGAALGWVEAPRGGAFHWVRLSNEGRILRYRVIPPSFANWHGFHLAVEKFAFQDFPIILSTFNLSVAENDR
jgi:formate hydrogenlyase subunit 5